MNTIEVNGRTWEWVASPHLVTYRRPENYFVHVFEVNQWFRADASFEHVNDIATLVAHAQEILKEKK